jgi:hypothetical protein
VSVSDIDDLVMGGDGRAGEPVRRSDR